MNMLSKMKYIKYNQIFTKINKLIMMMQNR